MLAAGCERVETSASPTPPQPSPTAIATAPAMPVRPVEPSAPTTLAGEWRVAGIDGKPFDEPYGLALSADDRKIWMEPRCAGIVRSYRITGARIAIGPPPDPQTAVCAIGMPPRTDDVMRALDAADTISRTPANGVELSGGAHSLTLFSQ